MRCFFAVSSNSLLHSERLFTYDQFIYLLQYSQLLKIRNRVGKDEFPLIDQTYYQSFNEMVSKVAHSILIKDGKLLTGNCQRQQACGFLERWLLFALLSLLPFTLLVPYAITQCFRAPWPCRIAVRHVWWSYFWTNNVQGAGGGKNNEVNFLAMYFGSLIRRKSSKIKFLLVVLARIIGLGLSKLSGGGVGMSRSGGDEPNENISGHALYNDLECICQYHAGH